MWDVEMSACDDNVSFSPIACCHELSYVLCFVEMRFSYMISDAYFTHEYIFIIATYSYHI